MLFTPALIALWLWLAPGQTPAAPPPPPAAAAPDLAAGRALAAARCGGCHAVDAADASAHPEAPPLRELHRRYPVETLEEALGEGIMVGHPDMPEFAFEPGQIRDLIAWLRSLEPDAEPGR